MVGILAAKALVRLCENTGSHKLRLLVDAISTEFSCVGTTINLSLDVKRKIPKRYDTVKSF